jgi:hypothetical protein
MSAAKFASNQTNRAWLLAGWCGEFEVRKDDLAEGVEH